MSKPQAQQPINGGHLPRMGRDYIRQVTRMRDDREPTLCDMIADEAAAFGVPEADCPIVEMAVGFREPSDEDGLVFSVPRNHPQTPSQRRAERERNRVAAFWDDDSLRQRLHEAAYLSALVDSLQRQLAIANRHIADECVGGWNAAAAIAEIAKEG